MKIKYTDHSLDRLIERRITKREVESALKQGKKTDLPYQKIRSSHRNKRGIVSVVYTISNPNPLTIIIITAYIE